MMPPGAKKYILPVNQNQPRWMSMGWHCDTPIHTVPPQAGVEIRGRSGEKTRRRVPSGNTLRTRFLPRRRAGRMQERQRALAAGQAVSKDARNPSTVVKTCHCNTRMIRGKPNDFVMKIIDGLFFSLLIIFQV